jgi:Fur family ferric uptake transcriptional regulator
VSDRPAPRPFISLFGRYLREQGLPVTHQREAVADVVFTSEEHLSVDDIERRVRGRGDRIGKATIYRTLDLLVRSRLVEEHDFGEGFKRYEHRLSSQPVHEHLVCLECGKVIEFQSNEIMSLEARTQVEHGFVPVRHRLEIYGLCRELIDMLWLV